MSDEIITLYMKQDDLKIIYSSLSSEASATADYLNEVSARVHTRSQDPQDNQLFAYTDDVELLLKLSNELNQYVRLMHALIQENIKE